MPCPAAPPPPALPPSRKRKPCWHSLPLPALAALNARLRWLVSARGDQLTPLPWPAPETGPKSERAENWRIWLALAGRGWGKTRCGAEDTAFYALWHDNVRIAVIAPTLADARDICMEGESGLLSIIPRACIHKWNRSLGELVLMNGSRIKLFSADRPDRLRGPQHHRAWCDELASWPGRDAFDQLWFGLRLGTAPQAVITTTPRNTELIRELLARQGSDLQLTQGRTLDNAAHLSPGVLAQLHERYGGTRLGRQELDAELLEDSEGALWQRAAIDANRVKLAPALERVVIAIDPAMSSHAGSDETGIVAGARGVDGSLYVLADWSGRYSPDGWAARVASLYHDLPANLVVAEVNAGGEMVERILRQAAPAVRFKPVHALRGKVARALPIAALYEQGRVRHVGSLAALEDQMCRFNGSGNGGSPDRVDALVWALTELSEAARGEPQIRML